VIDELGFDGMPLGKCSGLVGIESYLPVLASRIKQLTITAPCSRIGAAVVLVLICCTGLLGFRSLLVSKKTGPNHASRYAFGKLQPSCIDHLLSSETRPGDFSVLPLSGGTILMISSMLEYLCRSMQQMFLVFLNEI